MVLLESDLVIIGTNATGFALDIYIVGYEGAIDKMQSGPRKSVICSVSLNKLVSASISGDHYTARYLNSMLNMTSFIMNKLLIALIVVVMDFMVSETIVVTTQSNSTNMDKQKMVVTWLETDNKTKTGGVP